MILDEIVAYKKEFVAASKRQMPLPELRARIGGLPVPPSFSHAIRRKPNADLNIIAEVKKASPSKGIIREDFDHVRIAADYAEHGAAAISVLTDEEFFQGHLNFLREIRSEVTTVPLLRKDFTIDEYQIYEAREAGAAAILLITSILDKFQLVDFRNLAESLDMGVLTEVHTEREADVAAEQGARIIGVNNRDLQTFKVDLSQTQRIVQFLGGPQPGFTFIAESGISTPDDVETMRQFGVDALLIGETFMRAPKPGRELQRLLLGDLTNEQREERGLDRGAGGR